MLLKGTDILEKNKKGMIEMLHLMNVEWKKVRLPVVLVTLLLSGATCILTCTLDKSYRLWFRLDSWEIGTAFLSLLFPLFVVIPVCWNLYYERKNNFLLYVLPRVKQKSYLWAKWLVYALCAFFSLFIPYMLSAIAALFINQPVLYENNSFYHVLAEMYIEAPLLYAFLLSFWKGIIGVLVMTFGFVLSMYVKNIFVILTGPFIYLILENFILSILQLPMYRLVVSFEPTSMANDVVTIGSMIAGPVLLVIVIVCTALFMARIKKLSVVDL